MLEYYILIQPKFKISVINVTVTTNFMFIVTVPGHCNVHSDYTCLTISQYLSVKSN